MPKSAWKILFVGAAFVGKTSLIEQIVYGSFNAEKPYMPTIEDTYEAWVEGDRTNRESIRIYDTAGLDSKDPNICTHHLSFADGVVMVFSVTSNDSFLILKRLKNEIDKMRGKELPIVVLGTKVDSPETREVDHMTAIRWADSEQVKLFEVLTSKRKTLQEPVTWLIGRINHFAAKSSQADVRKIFRRSGGKKDQSTADGEPSK